MFNPADSLRPTKARPQMPMFDQPFRIAHLRVQDAYWTITGWGPRDRATIFAAEDRIRVKLPPDGYWDLVVPDVSTPEWREAYARTALEKALRASVDLQIITYALNSVDCTNKGLPVCRFEERDLKDALRLVRLAKLAINCLDQAVIDHAIEEVATVICEGIDGAYPKLADQSERVQAHYHRWAVTAFNAARFALEGVQR